MMCTWNKWVAGNGIHSFQSIAKRKGVIKSIYFLCSCDVLQDNENGILSFNYMAIWSLSNLFSDGAPNIMSRVGYDTE